MGQNESLELPYSAVIEKNKKVQETVDHILNHTQSREDMLRLINAVKVYSSSTLLMKCSCKDPLHVCLPCTIQEKIIMILKGK